MGQKVAVNLLIVGKHCVPTNYELDLCGSFHEKVRSHIMFIHSVNDETLMRISAIVNLS